MKKIIIWLAIFGLIVGSLGKKVLAQEMAIEINPALPTGGSAQLRVAAKVFSEIRKSYQGGEKLEVELLNKTKNNIEVEVKNSKDEVVETVVETDQQGDVSFLRINPPAQFTPGQYSLKIWDNVGFEVEHDFWWGVLAINTNKSAYLLGETVYLQMASLNSEGHTICKGNLELTINDEVLSTVNGKIKFSDSCNGDNVTDLPDYYAYYQVGNTGTYQMKLKNLDNEFEIDDSFEVKETLPYEIERSGATRINPFKADYVMRFKVKANEDFAGMVTETVPVSFILNTPNSWQVDWKKGKSYEISYEYNAPDISPQHYSLGPLTLKLDESTKEVVFKEFRSWQIASDAVSWQSVGGIVVNSTTVGLALVAPTVADNDIMVAVLFGKDNIGHTAPAGWTRIGVQTTNTTAMTSSLWWKRAVGATDSGATFTFNKATDNNIFYAGVISAYSGARIAINPIDATAPSVSNNASSDTVTYATFDPTSTNVSVLAIGIYANDLTTAGAVGGTNPTLTNYFDLETGTGTDCSFFGFLGTSNGAATGARSHTTTSGTDAISQGWMFGLVAEESPTVVLNSPGNGTTETDTTPNLVFTGTDAESNSIEYNLQVDTVNTFDSILTTATKTLASGENSTNSITQDTNYVYAGVGTAPGKVVRINKSDFTTTVTKTLATGEDGVNSITQDTNYVYAGVSTAPGKVVRINKSDFTTTVTKTLAAEEFYINSITEDTNYVYAGISDNPGKVVRINKSDFTTTVTKTLATGEDSVINLTQDTNYVYAGLYTDPGKVVRINKSDFTTTSAKTLSTGEYFVSSVIVDTNYVYAGLFTAPGKVVRINMVSPLLSVYSTGETGFSGGASHPYTSGVGVTYTVQSALSNNTYYWRVAGIDPLGSNTYGTWSSVGNFVILGTTTPPGAGPTMDQVMRHGGWFSNGVRQPFTF